MEKGGKKVERVRKRKKVVDKVEKRWYNEQADLRGERHEEEIGSTKGLETS